MEVDASGTLSSGNFRGVIEGLELVGVSPGPILAAIGCDRRVFDPLLGRFPVALEHRFWEAIERHSQDQGIGVAIGQAYAHSGHHTIDLYVALHSETLRGAFSHIELLAPLSDDRGHLEVCEDATLAHARVYRDGGYPRAPGFMDALFASAVTILRERVTGFRLSSVQLRRARPRDLTRYEQAFGLLPEFSARDNKLSFERWMLDAPLQGSDATLGELLLQSAIRQLQDMPQLPALVARLHRVVLDGLERGENSLSHAARTLGTSQRTLRRKLAQHGTSFQAVLDGLRRDLAEDHLRNGEQSIEVISNLLGFTSASAFQRAFRRWHGGSPSAYRKAHKP